MQKGTRKQQQKISTTVTRVPHVKRAMLARQAAKTSKMAAPVTPSLAKQNKHKQQQKMGLTVCTTNESVCIQIVYYFTCVSRILCTDLYIFLRTWGLTA